MTYSFNNHIMTIRHSTNVNEKGNTFSLLNIIAFADLLKKKFMIFSEDKIMF